MSAFFNVQKVIGKRERHQRTQYRIHFENEAKSKAKWVYAEDCRCDTRIKNYEISRIHCLLGE